MKAKQENLGLEISGATLLPFGLAADLVGVSRQRIYQARDAGLIVTQKIKGWEMVTLASLYVWRQRPAHPIPCAAPVNFLQLSQAHAISKTEKAELPKRQSKSKRP